MTVLVGMLWTAAVALPVAQAPVTKANVVKISATIQAIDSTTRSLTLRDDKGNEDTFTVGPAVQRFNELKVGMRVRTTYYESLVLSAHPPKQAPKPTSATVDLTSSTGAPGVTAATQLVTTVTVTAIDTKTPTITVRTQDGSLVTRKVENVKNLEGVKVGTQIDITYTEAILLGVVVEK
jgi:hypothetical protein